MEIVRELLIGLRERGNVQQNSNNQINNKRLIGHVGSDSTDYASGSDEFDDAEVSDLSSSDNSSKRILRIRNLEDKILNGLLKDFGEMVPPMICWERIQKLLKEEEEAKEEEEEEEEEGEKWSSSMLISTRMQRRFLRHILENPITKQYPPLDSYTTKFIKHYYSMVEKANCEVVDNLLNLYMSLLMREGSSLSHRLRTQGEPQPEGFKVFRIATPLEDLTATIAIKVAAEMTNVGLVTWEAGFFLSEVILAHKEEFANKACVELGAGVGLTGIVLSEIALPKSIILTDCSAAVLRNIADNATQNGLNVYNDIDPEEAELPLQAPQCKQALICDGTTNGSESKEDGDNLVGTAIRVRELDWILIESSADLDVFEDVDIILAADVVYDTAMLPHLAKVISLFLSRRPETSFGLVATTVRNPATFATFLAQLEQHGIQHQDVSAHYRATSPVQFYYKRTENIVLSKLTLMNKSQTR